MLGSGKLRMVSRPLVPLAVAALVAGVAACDGPNQFQNPVEVGGSVGPDVVILTPRADSLSAKPLGDSLLVRVQLDDDAGLDSVRFFGETLRGDVNLGTDTVVTRFVSKLVVLPGVRDTVVTRYIQPVEDSVKEITTIVAVAYDTDGNASADTVSLVLGGPDVQLLNLVENQTVQAGLGLNLSVVARDPQGINEIEFTLSGVINQTITRPINPADDSVRVDTTVALPLGTSGQLAVSVRAKNTLDVNGVDGPVTANVVQGTGGDTISPAVDVAVSALPSLELTDSIFVTVSGADDAQGSGITEAGFTVKAISPSRADTAIMSGVQTFTPARTGTVSRTFAFPVFNVDSLALPDTLIYEITGYMTDGADNCTASVAETGSDFACASLVGGETVALGRAGFLLNRVHVAGRTVVLPQGGRIMDAVVDTVRRNLFLSNIERGRVEVFRLGTEQFGTAIGVGSAPWGMDMSRDGDSLWVANSGGTNFSVIDLDRELEVNNNRFFTPDVVLFDVELVDNDAGFSFVVSVLPQGDPGFSDRGQYMAVDSFGNLIYSTKTTLIGDLGTARKAYHPTGAPSSEVKLFVEHGVAPPAENFWAFAHIDSVATTTTSDTTIVMDPILMTADTTIVNSALVTFFDHVPGDPSMVITGSANTASGETPDNAYADLVTAGSDAGIVSGARWNLSSIGFADTTYVARSGDGGHVVIGEGSVTPVGRVLIYGAREDENVRLSGNIPVSDFIQNSSVPVRGVGSNYDGTLNVVRADQVYFFDEQLREQGFVDIANAGVAAGATMHPLHANAPGLQNAPNGAYQPDTHLAFVGGGDRTIEIIDTQRFARIGRVTIRDVVTGPLKAILPFPEDNLGRTCATTPITDRRGNFIGDAIRLYLDADGVQPIPPDGITEDDCIVAKVFATTSAGGVVVVPIRKADVLRSHPARTGGS